MVAIPTVMQKEGFPVVVQPEAPEPRVGKKHVILTSWASVTTALLVVVLIGGAFYTADLKARECTGTTTTQNSDHNTKDYSRIFDLDGDRTQEDFHLDEEDQTEMIIKKSQDGNIELITAIDYKRKISASYVPSADLCMLLAGVDMEWANDWNEAEKNKTIKVLSDEVKETNYKVSDNKVTDLSILPKEMKPFCQGKPTYWLQPDDGENSMEKRQKRVACIWVCVYIHVCYDWGCVTERRCYRVCGCCFYRATASAAN